MPIYEFYCADCNTIFSFFSAAVDTEAQPLCPRCGKVRLARKPSTFATLSHRSGEGDEGGDDDPFAGLDDSRLEGAMESAFRDLEGSGDEEDPRQMARALRRFSEAAGLEPGPRLEEMLHRLEAGEDPDRLEEELGGEEEGEEPSLEDLFRRKAAAAARSAPPPRVDPELYFL